VIRIKRPTKVPATLSNRGMTATERVCQQYQSDPDAFITGTQSFDFDRSIYGSKSVKNALLKAQHGKWAYCEAKVSHTAYGDVEHFRPKAAYHKTRSTPLARPGYYWLAYEWSNLLFCCQICNQTHKGNQFPLEDENQRAKSHEDDILKERPLLIDPTTEEPSAFVSFQDEYVVATNGNPRGNTTIDALGLNRESIIENRRDALKKLRILLKSSAVIAGQLAIGPDDRLRDHLAEINSHILDCTADSAEYAAMVRAALPARDFA
jgi:uncharacterized protein (TIGR02646 family)